MNVTIKQLKSFLTVSELGNFTRAAERLQMAQPALSLQVRELEAELGVRLFDRTTRRVELTVAGREFGLSAARILADLEFAVRSAHELADRKRGRIVVAAPPLLAAVMLPSVIVEFRKTFPGIEVVLIDARTDQIVSKVRSGEADFGVGTFAPNEDGIERATLAKDTLMVFCHETSDLLRLVRVSWQDLDGHPLIALTRESGIRLLVELGYESVGQHARPVFEVAQIATAIALVEADLGISVLPTYAWAAARSRKIVARPLTSPEVSREVTAITARGRSKPPAGERFLQLLRRFARSSVPTDPAWSF